MAAPLKVCVTGAAGQIGYSLLSMIGNGDVFGRDQPLILTLLDIPSMLETLTGVEMELQDCAMTRVKQVISTADPQEAFKDIDVAFLVGAMPRREGMLRKDLLTANAKIFSSQGKALDQVAKKTVKVVVVGNPANTNAMICSHFAPSIPTANFTALTRLDQNRAQAQIAARVGVRTDAVQKMIIWGNHSSTQFPDASHATVERDGETVPAYDAVQDDAWLQGGFVETVQKRGSAIIKARKLSSAMSAAKAVCDHVRDWWFGTPQGQWVSMGVMSDGSYGLPEGVIYSFPVTIGPDHSWKIVQGLPISDFARGKMEATGKELVEEKETAFSFLGVS